MLPGFVPFPPQFAARYRQKGYWRDRSLAQEFETVYQSYAKRTVLVDGEREFTYAELDTVTTNLALNLLDIGIQPLDRVCLPCPMCASLCCCTLLCKKSGLFRLPRW